MTVTDPFTMDLRLCDDDGWVSDSPIEETLTSGVTTHDASYLARHNRLANMSRFARGDKPRTQNERFMCTGDAHMAGEHFRCTSPAHAGRVVAVPVTDHLSRGTWVPPTEDDLWPTYGPPYPKLTQADLADTIEALVASMHEHPDLARAGLNLLARRVRNGAFS